MLLVVGESVAMGDSVGDLVDLGPLVGSLDTVGAGETVGALVDLGPLVGEAVTVGPGETVGILVAFGLFVGALVESAPPSDMISSLETVGTPDTVGALEKVGASEKVGAPLGAPLGETTGAIVGSASPSDMISSVALTVCTLSKASPLPVDFNCDTKSVAPPLNASIKSCSYSSMVKSASVVIVCTSTRASHGSNVWSLTAHATEV